MSQESSQGAAARPLLVYDGDCGFCGYWARYWQKLTGASVDYRPYQEVAARYPAIPSPPFNAPSSTSPLMDAMPRRRGELSRPEPRTRQGDLARAL